MSAELDWTRIVDELHAERGVSTGRMFSAQGLRLGDKYFAMLCRGEPRDLGIAGQIRGQTAPKLASSGRCQQYATWSEANM